MKNFTGPGPSTLSILHVDAWDGDENFLSAYLTMPPGAVFPIHRHIDFSEHVLVTKGVGSWEYWPLDAPKPIADPIKAGSSVYMAPNVLHKIVNTSPTETLEIMITAAPGRNTVQEAYEDWPDSPTAAGHPIELPWHSTCPPGQDLKEDL
ncbi:hypothetical protein HYH02_001520 [Chlamydomonas schloesseri]|uniref:Cupin type-2 domain-containing protein n=1 Tax=Chlamydomonas schloesseri TaxID=2026947 RepID=A0A836BBF8_9CHLO|nr:hypothetical protein HYH02_001520 [Chlamydomonas schloesseri]|eukprot:KAG2453293.1 hypothetical protein HYH02_001520 [Chlamydomonas schloesseri]